MVGWIEEMDGWMNGWMDRWNGRVDVWMDGEHNNLYYAVNVENDSLPAGEEVVTGEDIGEVVAGEVVREVGRVFTATVDPFTENFS